MILNMTGGASEIQYIDFDVNSQIDFDTDSLVISNVVLPREKVKGFKIRASGGVINDNQIKDFYDYSFSENGATAGFLYSMYWSSSGGDYDLIGWGDISVSGDRPWIYDPTAHTLTIKPKLAGLFFPAGTNNLLVIW